jgi:HEAT repeat protein
MLSVLMVLSSAAWALPSGVDPAVTHSLGLREDAVGKLAKDPAATDTLIEVLQTDPSPEVRARAASVLFGRWASATGDVDTHRDIAVWAAASGDPGVRAMAVRALVDTGDDYELVVQYLDDDNAGVRAAAYSACERWIERHPDRAEEVRAVLDEQGEPKMQDKARLFMEKVRAKMP